MEYLEGVFKEKTLAEWIEWFEPLDVSFAPVNTLPEALTDPHALFRGMIQTDDLGRRHIGPVIHFLREPARPVFREPMLGEHTRDLVGQARDGAGQETDFDGARQVEV
jgi:crotonobetainyl-CoA:carnitine CoA-transferase CaiB-like acyl-CoA transferase